MRLSVLGMGNMGHALASRLLERGHDVTIWNRTAGKAERPGAAGRGRGDGSGRGRAGRRGGHDVPDQ